MRRTGALILSLAVLAGVSLAIVLHISSRVPLNAANSINSNAPIDNTPNTPAPEPTQEATVQISDWHKSDNTLVSKDYGPAPEFNNKVWLNTDKPMKIADQKGKVVLIEFWTFECINCQHTLGAMKDFYAKYHDSGLTVMTDHFPEFSYEADVNNVKDFLTQNDIQYPVAIDNDGATWNAYSQRYWPTMYLVDKRGEIRYVAIGEHDYSQTEAAIKALLSE